MDASHHQVSSAWDEETAAALELIHMKHQRPPHTEECDAASELLLAILQGTNDSHHRLLAPRRRCPALLTAGDDSGASPSTVAPCKNGIDELTEFPIPIADSRDNQFLSPLQCHVRTNCAEYFAATASNATRGRQTPVEEGRIGVRCAFCKHLPRAQQAAQASEFIFFYLLSFLCICSSCIRSHDHLFRMPHLFTLASFPNKIASIYSSVVMLQCRHFPNCQVMPDSAREVLANLKKAGNSPAATLSGNTRQEYWADSARDMGFVDTNGGIRFAPHAQASPALSFGESKTLEDGVIRSTNDVEEELSAFPESMTMLGLPRPNVVSPFEPIISSPISVDFVRFIGSSKLVTFEDRDLVPDYVFLSLAQLQPCQITNDDRIAAYKDRPDGFMGLCCRHCQGSRPGPGFGRVFPESIRSLAQTTTTQTIVKHLTSKCQHVPSDIKDAISSLLQDATEDSKNSATDDGRRKYGSRKEFFQGIWDRLQVCGHATSSQQSNRSGLTTSFLAGKAIRPSPIRIIPMDSNSCDIVSLEEDSCNSHGLLFDNKNRRVTVTLDSKKRSGNFAPVVVPGKKPKV
ncbi:hypothetical protein ACHAXR_005574 [Thalassiosira sp. AJA248-18]